MSAPDRDAVYIHTPSAARFRYIGFAACTGGLTFRRVDIPDDEFFYVISVSTFAAVFVKADDLLALAEAIGVVPVVRGVQPVEEFTRGPQFTPSKWWTDENLAEVFELDQASGGGQ